MAFLNKDNNVFTSARDDGTGKPVTDVYITNHYLAEQKTQADAINGVLTFEYNLSSVGIFNVDATNTGVFSINGLNVTVPPQTTFEAKIAGTPGKTVTVTGSTSYIVSRYV